MSVDAYTPEELLALARRFRVGFLEKPEVKLAGRAKATQEEEQAAVPIQPQPPVQQLGGGTVSAGAVER